MSNRYISPALADLSQDIAGAVPVSIVKKWIEGNSTEQEALEILENFTVKGTVVSTDTSGLSRLSLEKDLLDVLKIISDPKEIIYGLGTSIGGKALGRWVADNTQMFYRTEIAVPDIIAAMLQAKDQISIACEVPVGFGVHYGTFLNIGNGMYGKEADFVESFAENNAQGGEILISESVVRKVEHETSFIIDQAKDLDGQLEKIYRLHSDKISNSREIKDRDYPIYFDKRFFSLLRKLEEPGIKNIICKDYLRTRIVVLIQRGPVAVTLHVGGLLDNLVINAAFAATLNKTGLIYKDAGEIKCAGGIAIFVFEPDAAQTVVSFSREARRVLAEEGIPSTIGIDYGDVVLFPLEDGTMDIAGGPVNIASKMATDFGTPDNIYITEKTARMLPLPECDTFKVEISHIVIQGYVIKK